VCEPVDVVFKEYDQVVGETVEELFEKLLGAGEAVTV
jgi:hypothetical protein